MKPKIIAITTFTLIVAMILGFWLFVSENDESYPGEVDTLPGSSQEIVANTLVFTNQEEANTVATEYDAAIVFSDDRVGVYSVEFKTESVDELVELRAKLEQQGYDVSYDLVMNLPEPGEPQ